MKLFAALFLSLLAVPALSTIRADDPPPPPPFDCPFCGGNAELHQARIQFMANLHAEIVLIIGVSQ